MCDTLFKKFSLSQQVFAKNSDRDPLEPQILEYAEPSLPQDSKYFVPANEKYLNNNLATLKKAFVKYNPNIKAIISRPSWIWGAEMGVNEAGVSIGNEAVFSFRGKLFNDGLLGMDILRLALHTAKSANQAADIIIDMIQVFGQGGNCAFRGQLKYHNSFLIADSAQAFVLETAGMDWAIKKISDFYSISNTYTITNDFDRISSEKIFNFKLHFEAKAYNIFTRGQLRRKYTMTQLEKLNSPMEIRNIMRSHISSQEPRPTMASICMHSPRLIKSQTTASLISHYINNKTLLWVTNSPLPCLSIYKPLNFSFAAKSPWFSPQENLKIFMQRRSLTEKLMKNKKLANEFHLKQKTFEQQCLQKLSNFDEKDDAELNYIISQCWNEEMQLIKEFMDK